MIIGGNNNGNRNPLNNNPAFNNKFKQPQNTNFVNNNYRKTANHISVIG